jgi:hypothetical protein
MLITRKFVMINFPKTGSTFARKVLLRVHEPSPMQRWLLRTGLAKPGLEELLMRKFFFTEAEAKSKPNIDQHGTYSQLPERHRNKVVMSVARDPEERLFSAYEFRAWERKPFPSMELLMGRYPRFPKLSFEEYFEMNQVFSAPFAQPPGMQVHIGPMTTQFIRFYARDPLKTILSLRENTDLRRDWDLHFPKITFLHTEDLNNELHDFLLKMGYAPKEIAFIREEGKVNATPRSRKEYLTPALRDTFRHNERFLFQIFPEYLKGA